MTETRKLAVEAIVDDDGLAAAEKRIKADCEDAAMFELLGHARKYAAPEVDA